MSKSDNNGNGTSAAVHIVLQGKGGVGKTCVSNILAQYLGTKGTQPKCYDTDLVNASLCRFKGLAAERIPVMEADVINYAEFDRMFEAMVSDAGPFIVDTGATTFAPLWNHITANSVVGVLKEYGRRVFIHVPITGGQSQPDTLQGFDDIARMTTQQNLVVWLNEHFGKIETSEKKPFHEMQVFQEHSEKIAGIVVIQSRTQATFGEDMKRMFQSALTFQEAIESPKFGIFSKQRLQTIRKDLFNRLDKIEDLWK
jgi:hypothetical protein